MLNTRNRNHANVNGRTDAFFDLDRDKHTVEMELLHSNAICCVLSYADKQDTCGDVILCFWVYQKLVEDDAENSWYLTGTRICALTMPKTHLLDEPDFKECFNRNGDFKRFSIQTRT